MGLDLENMKIRDRLTPVEIYIRRRRRIAWAVVLVVVVIVLAYQ